MMPGCVRGFLDSPGCMGEQRRNGRIVTLAAHCEAPPAISNRHLYPPSVPASITHLHNLQACGREFVFAECNQATTFAKRIVGCDRRNELVALCAERRSPCE